MKKTIYFFILIGIGFYLSGCATIMSGSKQDVPIHSTPPGATVMINDSIYGKTPMLMTMKRSKPKRHLKLVLAGYETWQGDLCRGFNGVVLCNIFIGGLIGMGIDALSGAWYKVT